MTKHTMRALYETGNDSNGMEVLIIFNRIKGSPERGPAYDHGGLPADPDEIEFISVRPAQGALLLPAHMQPGLDDWAREWLEEGEGFTAACLTTYEDDEMRQEEALEMRRDR